MASIEKIPPQVEAKIRKLREVQARLQEAMALKNSLLATINELERVLEELKKYPDDAEVYKLVGSVLVKASKEQVVKELEDRKEQLNLKLMSTEKMIEALKTEADKLEEEVRRLLAGGGAPPAAGG